MGTTVRLRQNHQSTLDNESQGLGVSGKEPVWLGVLLLVD